MICVLCDSIKFAYVEICALDRHHIVAIGQRPQMNSRVNSCSLCSATEQERNGLLLVTVIAFEGLLAHVLRETHLH